MWGCAFLRKSNVLDGMGQAPVFYFEALSQVRPPCFANGRVGLVGDAAWCASPISGMGTTLALLGAYVLAGELSRHDDHCAAWGAYESVMRPYVRKAQRLPPATPRIAHPRSPTGVRLLNAAPRLAASPIASHVRGRLQALSPIRPTCPTMPSPPPERSTSRMTGTAIRLFGRTLVR
jgi:2-polyprenyl-6-methoxyphenol hydroxylase-like FAD-dependent oxidoreductase